MRKRSKKDVRYLTEDDIAEVRKQPTRGAPNLRMRKPLNRKITEFDPDVKEDELERDRDRYQLPHQCPGNFCCR